MNRENLMHHLRCYLGKNILIVGENVGIRGFGNVEVFFEDIQKEQKHNNGFYGICSMEN